MCIYMYVYYICTIYINLNLETFKLAYHLPGTYTVVLHGFVYIVFDITWKCVRWLVHGDM